MEECTIDVLRNEITKTSSNLDAEVRTYEDYVTRALTRTLLDLKVAARVVNNGSTHQSRRTYVMDPSGTHNPFPPDIDLNVVVYGDEVPEGLEDLLFERIMKGSSVYVDGNDNGKKIIGVRREGNFNISTAIYSEKTYGGNKEISYNDLIGEFDEKQRLEARTLKVILQRNGCYGGWNRAIKGIAVDEMVRSHGSTEQCLSFLQKASESKAVRKLYIPTTEENLLGNVSHYVWGRVKRMTALHAQKGTIKADSFEGENWKEMYAEKVTAVFSIGCSPGSCGREPSTIAREVRRYLSNITGLVGIEGGTDYHLIPHQGENSEKGNPHTFIFVAIDPKDKYFSGEKFFALITDHMEEYARI